MLTNFIFQQCVFTDVQNQILYQTSDNGLTIRRLQLKLSPSDVAYDEEDTDTFVILDKVDPMKKVLVVNSYRFIF